MQGNRFTLTAAVVPLQAVVPLYYRCGSWAADEGVEFVQHAVSHEFRM